MPPLPLSEPSMKLSTFWLTEMRCFRIILKYSNKKRDIIFLKDVNFWSCYVFQRLHLDIHTWTFPAFISNILIIRNQLQRIMSKFFRSSYSQNPNPSEDIKLKHYLYVRLKRSKVLKKNYLTHIETEN